MASRFAVLLGLVLAASPAGALGTFTCYQAKDLKQPKFVATTVSLLSDQFATRTGAAVKKPALLCSPASVDGQAAVAPAAHLACYKTKPHKLAAPVQVQMTDALGGGRLALQKATLLCVPAAATVQPVASSGSLLALTYNVAGLPEGLSGSHPAANTPLIAPRLNAYDLVLMQETWQTPNPNPLAPTRVYHEILVAGSQHPYKSVSATHPFGSDPDRPSAILGDGLNLFSRFRFDDTVRQRWSGCWNTAADCLALKGFSVSRMVLPIGGSVDVYDLHMEAGSAPEDKALRDAGVTQLATFINAHSAGRAVIVGGDFNLHTDREPDATQFQRLLADANLTDACAFLGCPDPARIDKVLVRSSAQVTLTPTSWSLETADFLDGDGEPLSDHEPVAVRIDWTVAP
ncbi:endonuclease/exonuclease/phosphatase family protein [bacterium]|nr:endonuclease/exonuclease/phosphatase family protein [bacterium]